MSIDSLTGFKAMCGSFTGLTVIAVTLRFVARKKGKLALRADDWSMLAAVTFFVGTMTTVYLLARVNFSGYNGGQGSNEVNIFVEQVTSAFQLLTIWTLGAAKASVLFFYKRVFCQYREMNSALRVAIIVTLAINACWVIGFFFLGLFQCGAHFSFGGNHFSYCTHLNQFQQGFYISDIILDVWILAMPIPYIIRLNVSLARKLACVLIFLLSFVGLGASIARLVYYYQTPQISPGHHSSTSGRPRTRSAWTTYLWFGTLEMGTAIVAINLPILYGLFAKHAPEALLRATRSWTSIASRAFTGSDRSSATPRAGSEISRPSRDPLKLETPYSGGRSFADSDISRTLSIDDLRISEVSGHKNTQMSSEKTYQEV